jgi:hypothetical protein
MAFSKVIHLCWFQGIDLAPANLRQAPALWRELNPGYEVLIWDFQSLSSFIASKYPQYFSRWNRLDKVIKKCDFARLLLVHYFGGFYFDLDLLPRTSLDSFMDAGVVRHMTTQFVTVLPSPEPLEAVDLHSRDFILSREHRPIDEIGFGVANGQIASKPGLPLWIDFLEAQIGSPDVRVLDYLGPWALTRFLRARTDLRGRGLIVPPYYFLWEDAAFQQPPPSWCVTRHLAENNWGDKSKGDWWMV